MSRVFSRRRPVAFCCGCVSDSSGAADRVLEMREMPQPLSGSSPAPQESSRSAPARPVALNHSGTKCDCKNCENNESSTKMGSGASAGECAAAAAGECVFGSVFADMACGMPPAPPLLWPCLLLPMVKGTAARHQQALAAQAEQRRIRGR